ncbi:MAG: copper chaperone PCu(A)C [Conchiformibius sp.]|nr:copper chaperone PCu(A)C [Conchiformibius sp.]
MKSFKPVLFASICAVLAHAAAAKGVEVRGEAYARPTVSGQKQSGAFFTLHNTDAADNVLVAATAPVQLAGRTELHTHINDKGVMRMREVKGGIPLPAKATVELKPGSYHVMFFDLKQTLTVGKTFPLNLKFKNGRSKTITVKVKPMTAAPAHQHGKESGQNHHQH